MTRALLASIVGAGEGKCSFQSRLWTLGHSHGSSKQRRFRSDSCRSVPQFIHLMRNPWFLVIIGTLYIFVLYHSVAR